jgi:hypothetical protein
MTQKYYTNSKFKNAGQSMILEQKKKNYGAVNNLIIKI